MPNRGFFFTTNPKKKSRNISTHCKFINYHNNVKYIRNWGFIWHENWTLNFATNLGLRKEETCEESKGDLGVLNDMHELRRIVW